jgi:hypothetical protein
MTSDDCQLAIALPHLPSHAGNVPAYASIKVKFWALLVLLFVALLVIACITTISLQDDGSTWMSETAANMKVQQINQLSSLVNSKSLFIKVCFVTTYCQTFCTRAFLRHSLNK